MYQVDMQKPVAFTFIMNSLADHGTICRFLKPDVVFKNDSFVGIEKEIVGMEHTKELRIIRDVVRS